MDGKCLFVSVHRPLSSAGYEYEMLVFGVPVRSVVQDEFSFKVGGQTASAVGPQCPGQNSSLVIVTNALRSTISTATIPSVRTNGG